MKKVNLKDVAQHVGVSTALVSYVLNGQAVEKQVNKETAERIVIAAKELNYLPNQIAKSLKMRKTHTIGLVVADINYRFSTGITRAIESEAKKKNYTVIYGSSNENEEKFAELIDVFVNRRVDGLILVPVENSQDQIRKLQKTDVPFVLVDRIFPEMETNCIALDNHKASYTSTSYLIARGHKKIAMVNYKTTLFHLLERNRGYRDALNEQGIKEEWLYEINTESRSGDMEKALSDIISQQDSFDAIFFATDTLALDGLKLLNNKEIKVPEGISVFSFDESEAFELFYTPITHSKQPLEEMGKLAFNTLIELINQNKVNKLICLQADLIVGQSCREILV
ncbi:LacI family DNA-binding transcriptional regulator [Arcticibacter eurypsychrophilus]|uniref:LacI family DNA-binding transcriptional regulator n=1 Tax=Arcticibacter eurypsychrophilus TaxID=1434752 RepID=UPI00084CF1B8|nr:substrate-binding domain-containing protein [Arcticibacter eurypsychrophilus]